MNNSSFEDSLRKKSLNFKTNVSPDIFTGIKAGLKTNIQNGVAISGKIGALKTIVAKTTYSIAIKAIISITSIASLTIGSYVLIDSNLNKIKENKKIIHINKPNNKFINTDIHQAELENFIKTMKNNRSILQNRNSITTVSKAKNRLNIKEELNFTIDKPFYNLVKKSTKKDINKIQSINQYLTLKNNKLNLPLDIKTYINDFEKNIHLETNTSTCIIKKINYTINFNIGKTYLLKNVELSKNHNEESKASFTGAALVLDYKLNNQFSISVKTEYQNIGIVNQFFSEKGKDGEIEKQLNLIKIMPGCQYRLYRKKKWDINVLSHVGLAYKIKHENTFSGIYFENSFTKSLKQQNKLSPVVDLSINLNYNINKNIAIGASLNSDYIYFDSNSKIINVGGQIGLTYKWR
ncbi:MAG: hypothetical protein WBG43_06060 [Marinifilaceae bacterium]